MTEFHFKDLQMSGDPKEEEKKIEYALVLVTPGGRAWLVHGVGVAIEGDLDAGLTPDEAGPVGLAPEEAGLWVWEGIPSWRSGRNWEGIDEGAEPIYENKGQWRRATPEELSKILPGNFDGLFGPSRWPPPEADPRAPGNPCPDCTDGLLVHWPQGAALCPTCQGTKVCVEKKENP